MGNKYIIFVPGKNLKPVAREHKDLLWQTLTEGLRRVNHRACKDITSNKGNFKLISWNYIFYHKNKNISDDVMSVAKLIKKSGPTKQDILESNTWHYKFDYLFYSVIDFFPWMVALLTGPIKYTVRETRRYFCNKNNIACEIRETLKQELRPILSNNNDVLLIGHSMGSIILYDALWELSHLEKLPGKINLLTIGSPLGMNYVQHNLLGSKYNGKKKYPTNIKKWTNISAVGDITALDNKFADDFDEMIKLKLIKSITDYCDDVYNYFRDKNGINCHKSYGYLINATVSKVIINWWQHK